MMIVRALLNTVLPVFLLAALGWVARRYAKIEVKDPARLAIYVLNPAMALNAVLTTQMNASEISKIIGFMVLLTFAMVAITMVASKFAGYSLSERNATMLSTAFMNAGNYGTPVVMLAFGQAGFERAAVVMICESMFLGTLAVFFAAYGQMNVKDAVRSVFRMPQVWATVVGLAIRLTGFHLPAFLMTPIGMLSSAGLTVMIVVLGMQVAGVRVSGARTKIALSSVLRLVISPVAGLGLVWLLKPDPLTAKVLVLESAMPAAVNSSLLAAQFGTEPDLVSGVTLATTFLSLVTVTSWILYLQS